MGVNFLVFFLAVGDMLDWFGYCSLAAEDQCSISCCIGLILCLYWKQRSSSLVWFSYTCHYHFLGLVKGWGWEVSFDKVAAAKTVVELVTYVCHRIWQLCVLPFSPKWLGGYQYSFLLFFWENIVNLELWLESSELEPGLWNHGTDLI